MSLAFDLAQMRNQRRLFPPMPWTPDPTPTKDDESDSCSRSGALKLKATIEAYWKERGEDIEVEIKAAPFIQAMRSARYDVRSHMVDGQPRKIPVDLSRRTCEK
jgi:hypothetical protein